MQPLCTWGLAAALALGADPTDTKPGNFDWPQWQGPDRTALCKETNLLQEWPKAGPTLVWSVKNLGGGYSTPSIAAGRVFGMSYRGDDEGVWALSEADGKELWFTRIAAKGKAGYNEGPRCTPTVDGELLYALGISGDLACLEASTGKIRWQKNLKKDFGGQVGGWAYSESPLVDGDKLLVTPGGEKATIVALDKKSGDLIWKGSVPKGNGAHYSSIIPATVDGKRQYIQFLSGGVVGLDGDGKYLWRYDHQHNGTANCSTPIYRDGHVFASSNYGTGGGLVKLNRTDKGYTADEVYFEKKIANHHGGLVLVGDYLYGEGGGRLTCMEFKTGKVMWSEGKAGKGSILYADGRLYYRNEGGPIILVDANPEKYVERGRFNQPEKSGKNTWPHPVIANGKLYIRDQDLLYVYDVKAK